jgi:hypothetical protein
MIQLGHRAMDKNKDLFRFEWSQDNTFYICRGEYKHIEDPKDFTIIVLAQLTAND